MNDPIEPDVAYLGDGLYVKIEHGQIVLMSGSHDHPDHTVYLEPEVYFALTKFLERSRVWNQ